MAGASRSGSPQHLEQRVPRLKGPWGYADIFGVHPDEER
jgi:hypothetical protein